MVESKDKLNHDKLMSSEESEVKLSVSEATFNIMLERVKPDARETVLTQLTDTYYDDPTFLFTNLNRGLRLRTSPSKPPVLEFKSLFFIPKIRPENPWLVEEKTFRVPIEMLGIEALEQIFKRFNKKLVRDQGIARYDKEGIDSLFKNNGLEASIVVSKERTEALYDQHTFSFDHILGLGYFIEIETHDRSNPIDLIADFGDFIEYEIVREGYNDMLAQQYPEVVPTKQRQERFLNTPSWNIQPDEEGIIQALIHL